MTITTTTWKDTPTRRISVGGVDYAYRKLGTGSGVPVVFLHHPTAVHDDSGHGGVFQYHQKFVPEVLRFLADGGSR